MPENPTVSILIPAYNQPYLLKRAINSVSRQNYRPIQVVVVDDNSPNDLVHALIDFKSGNGISYEYYKNPQNLGPYWNIFESRKYINGKYLLYLPHDDYLVNDSFISHAVKLMEDSSDCNLVIGNSILEDSLMSMMKVHMNEYFHIDGNEYLRHLLWKELHPAYSGVIFNNKLIIQRGYNGLALDKKACLRIGIEPDEFFASVVLAAEDSSVAVTGQIVSVRGTAENSYSKSDFWRKSSALSCFLPAFQLYKYFKNKQKIKEAFTFANLIVNIHSPSKISLSLLRFLNYDRDAIVLMFLGFSRYLLRVVTSSPRRAKDNIRRVFVCLARWLLKL